MKEKWSIIQWEDIISIESPWMSREEVNELKPVKMLTVGHIVKETDKYIVVASTVESGKKPGSFGNLNAIPKGVILSIEALSPSIVKKKEIP